MGEGENLSHMEKLSSISFMRTLTPFMKWTLQDLITSPQAPPCDKREWWRG
jgi:hypothetical protein